MHEIKPLTSADIADAMVLVEAAGWNQTARDWQRVIDYQPDGCFKAVLDGRLVGTVTSTSYQQDLAWIGMMLVDPVCRRQGIGRALMLRVIESLKQAHVQTIKLDATPAGRPLYEQLGFVAQFDFQRWSRSRRGETIVPLTNAGLECLDKHKELDRRVFGVDRWSWLKGIAADSQCVVQPDGYGMLRRGRIADYVGPLIAESPSAAYAIGAKLVRSSAAVLFWDLLHGDEDFQLQLRALGFEPVRTLTRMVLQRDLSRPEREYQYAICDPATG